MRKISIFEFGRLEYAGGAEKQFITMGNYLKNKNHQVTFVTCTKSTLNLLTLLLYGKKATSNYSANQLSQELNGTKNYRFGFLDLVFPTANRLRIGKVLRESDAIISKNEIFDIIVLRYFFGIGQKKIVYWLHTPIQYPIARTKLARLHNLIYNSKFYTRLIGQSRCIALTFNQMQTLKKLQPKLNIRVIPNSIDTKEFSVKKYSKHKKFNIYYIGRMTEQKGIDTLYKTILTLSKEPFFKHLEFYFVGNGAQESYLKALDEKFQNCHFLGFDKSMVQHYKKADMVVVPSRWEGSPMVLLEAQACGVPVITTKSEGCREVITHGINGYISEIDDVNGIASNISRLYHLWKDEFPQYISMRQNARDTIVQNYQNGPIKKKFEDYLVAP